MQIFVLDSNPKLAARYHADRHVIKLILESAQLLCTAVKVLDGKQAPYKPTHINHPCAVWARASSGNYDWLLEYGEALCAEYSARYHKTHKTEAVIRWCRENKPRNIPAKGLTPFALAMPDEFKVPGNPVASYRNYYNRVKVPAGICFWKSGVPAWVEYSFGKR